MRPLRLGEEKRRKKKEETGQKYNTQGGHKKRKPQGKNIMACPIP